MTDDQKKEALHLALELRYHAQNNEMIDQYYTELGNLCNNTAEFLEGLVNEQ
jgi:hypothetical protein